MADESTGEFKLLKVWECKKCKSLIKDARKISGHGCTVKEEEDKLLEFRKIIDDRDLALDERDKFIDSQKRKIDGLVSRIEGLEHFIKELNASIDDYNNAKTIKDELMEKQKLVIEDQKKIVDNLNATIEEQRTAANDQNAAIDAKIAIIDGQSSTIENQRITIEDQKKIIANQNVAIEEQRSTIENQKRNQSKIVEKIVYLEKGASNADTDKTVNNINVDIWQKDNRIKDSKDSGYREEIEVEIFERGKGKEKIIIKNGKVMKKPDDIIIIGKSSQEGFIVKGIYRN
jgi:uncharacterized coiled-coil protein SlyX